MSRESELVVGLVGGSHLVNHAYLILLPPAFPYLTRAFDVSTTELGLAVGLLGAVVTLLQLPLGYISDTYSRRLVLGFSLAFGAVGCAMAALAPSFGWLLAAQIVMGVGVAGHHPAHYPLLSAATAKSRRGRAYSIHGFAGALGLAAPFAVVPAAYALGFGWRAAFGAVALFGAVYAVGCLAAFRDISRDITHPPEARPLPRPGTFTASVAGDATRQAAAGFRSQVRSVAGAPTILVLTALWFVNSVAVWGVRTYAPTLLVDGYGLAPASASLVGSVMLGVGAVVIIIGGYLTDGVGALAVTFAGYAALVALAAGVGSVALPTLLAVGVVLLLTSTIDVSRPARSKLTDAASPEADVGKNFALMTVGISAGGAVAPPAFGLIVEQLGVGAAFYAVAGVALVALALTATLRSVQTRNRSGRPTAGD